MTQRRTWNHAPPPSHTHLFSHYIEYPATCSSDQLAQVDAGLGNPVSEGPQRLERATRPAREAAVILRDAAWSRRAAKGSRLQPLGPGLILRTSTGHMQDVCGAGRGGGGDTALRSEEERKGNRAAERTRTLFCPASRSDSEPWLHHPRSAVCHSHSVGIPNSGNKNKQNFKDANVVLD